MYFICKALSVCSSGFLSSLSSVVEIKFKEMRKIILGLSVICIAMFATDVQAQVAVKKGEVKTKAVKGANITLEKSVHDYGTVVQNADGNCVFEFTNNGTKPLVISQCKGSCGCTVPTWPREEIKPGETGEIKVKYDTNRVGPINRSVTIISNAANSPTKVLKIKGMVEPTDASAH